jgi:hypothetical protein
MLLNCLWRDYQYTRLEEKTFYLYICVLGVSIFPLSTILLLDFGTVPTVVVFLFFRCFKHTIFSEHSVTTLDTISNKVITLATISNKWNNRNETLQNPFVEVHYKKKILNCFYFLSDGARGKFVKYPLLMKSIQKYVSFCLVQICSENIDFNKRLWLQIDIYTQVLFQKKSYERLEGTFFSLTFQEGRFGHIRLI